MSDFRHRAVRECLVRRKLQQASEHCRDYGFSPTDFASPCAPNCTGVALDLQEMEDTFPIDRAFPGLRVLNEDFGVFLVDDFVAPEHLQAPFEQPRIDHPSSTPGNKDFVAAIERDPEFCLKVRATDDAETNRTRSREECGKLEDYLRSHGMHVFAHESGVRTSFEVHRPREFWAEAAEAIHKRIGDLLPEFPRSMHEDILVSRYERGGFYTPHWDGRRCTVIIYANDEGEGGATYFPVLNLRVARKTGRAVVFFPITEGGVPKAALLHTAEEQLEGEKRVLQIFINPVKFDTHKIS